VRQELWDALAPLRQRRERLPVKWVRPENIHLSLKFLGEVEETRDAELRTALQRAAKTGEASRPLTLRITGFGVFPDYHRPHVLWAGVTPEPGLELLQHGVEQAFAPLGFPTEARAFSSSRHSRAGSARREAAGVCRTRGGSRWHRVRRNGHRLGRGPDAEHAETGRARVPGEIP
jgi:hypothetical protein